MILNLLLTIMLALIFGIWLYLLLGGKKAIELIKYKSKVEKLGELIKYGFIAVIIFFSIILVFFSKYYNSVYGNYSLDEILFFLSSGLKGANLSVIYNFFKDRGVLIIISLIFVFSPFFILEEVYLMKVKIINSYKFTLAYAMSIFTISIIFSYKTLGVSSYLEKSNEYSNFIGKEYISPKDTKIKFPEHKRNLIVIYLESTETTMMDKTHGGGWEYSVTPELEKLALQNINFSNTDTIGGAYSTVGTTWTIAGLVSTTSGLPLKMPIDGNKYTKKSFLGGAITLGDILKDQGYNLEFMCGSDSNFGGRNQYFSNHGSYKIFDLNTAIQRKLMTSQERVYWGFEDSSLFQWAKQELVELESEKRPFNFNLLTVNTHFQDGWLEKDAANNYSTQYENVNAYSSKQVSEFVDWLQQQDFYKNTTVILLGDHNSMQSVKYYKGKISKGFTRVTYNAIINSPIQPINTKQRKFSNLDMFPTILASIGVEISGNRLGLGTNLFSSENTLFEKYGIDYVNSQLRKKSIFYNAEILQDDYLELLNSEDDSTD